LVQEGFEPAVANHPALSGVVTFPKKAIREASRRLDPRPLRAFLRLLRAKKYDEVWDLQGLARSGLFSWATGAPRRVGFANARELGWLGYTQRHRVSSEVHTVDRMLALLEAAGVAGGVDMRLHTSPSDRAWLAGVIASGRLTPPYAVLAPTSRWPAKQWPAERFAELAKHLRARGVNVAVVGASGEQTQIGPVLSLAELDTGVTSFVGATHVGQLMALIEQAALVVANDSAALHMAVGFDRPLVALYGPTRVHRVGPYGREKDVIQHASPNEISSHKDASQVRLMERITLEEVRRAVEQRLAGG